MRGTERQMGYPALPMRCLAALALLLACFAGCGDDGGSGETSTKKCVAGKQIACPCPGGAEGVQVCRSDGSGYDACIGCGAGGAGGTGGSGAGGSAGSGGGAGGKRSGAVVLDGGSLSDDQGRFHALGATLMWAAWGFRHDKARLAQNLEFLAKHGFHYIRALGVVGDYSAPDYWDGREIDWHWPDYDQVIAGLTDLAYDQYGLRVEWTLIGDGQKNLPSVAEREALVDRFVQMSKGREQKIIHFEIANEAWQNGFGGPQGVAELRALTQYLNGKTSILVAASAPDPSACAQTQELYAGGIAELATLHFDRDVSQVDGHWRPVWQPWWVHTCAGIPVASNNEPIGPGASVSSENGELELVSGAVASYVSGLPLHVFHSGAGVRGDQNLWEMAGADKLAALASYVPSDVTSWERRDPKANDAPLRFHAESGGQTKPDTTWPELPSPEAGVVAAPGSVKGKSFVVLAIGILDHVEVEARSALSFDVVDVLSGQVVAQHSLAAGQKASVSGAGARFLRGTLK